MAVEKRAWKLGPKGEKHVWWQQERGVVTRYWSAYDPPAAPHHYAGEREALQAARAWLAAEIKRRQLEIGELVCRSWALEQREKELAEGGSENG